MTERRSGYQSAESFLSDLENDPNWIAKQQKAAREQAELEKQSKSALAPVFDELALAGSSISNFDLLPVRGPRHSPQAVDIILKWAVKLSEPNLVELLVRHLINAEKSFDAGPLLGLFERNQTESVRWAIANTLYSAPITCDLEWIRNALYDRSFGKSREMLILAFQRMAQPELANKSLLPLFSQFPGHVAKALAETGKQKELAFLSSQAIKYRGWVKKEINRAVKKIARRLTLDANRGVTQ